mgnify:FL=1|tara:strand:+ start:320 stop:712 length:393 start_codon:yes stop_codon:yes gene_type:complete
MKIKDKNDNLLAYVIKKNDQKKGKNFYTDSSEEFQLASFDLDESDEILRHIHISQERTIKKTSEAIFLQEGSLTFSIYDEELKLISEVTLDEGDVILLIEGGHGVKINGNAKFLEVKQGPYIENNDKKRF